MAPKSSMKSKRKPVTKSVALSQAPVKITPATRTRSGAIVWHGDVLVGILKDIQKRARPNGFFSIGKVVCFSWLYHGPHVELNVFGQGSNCFRVAPDWRHMCPGAIYMFHVVYDDDSGEEIFDECTAGTISSVRYLGTAKSISDASRRMTLNVSSAVVDMLSYNRELDVDEMSAEPVGGVTFWTMARSQLL